MFAETDDTLTPEPLVRIGELSRRTEVSTDTLRAWERRYGLLEPRRSDGGFRLYGPADERRVHAMRTLISQGLSAAEAATLARAGGDPSRAEGPAVVISGDLAAERLRAAWERLDDAGAQAAMDEALNRLTLDAALLGVILPALRTLGERWRTGEVSVGQEHFATNLIRGRLLGLARGWGLGAGPYALLACPPAELHELGLISFGLALHARGWRIAFLGADTPIETIVETAMETSPEVIVLSAVTPGPLRESGDAIRRLSATWPVAIGGAGASGTLADELGARNLADDPVEAAVGVAAQG
jgi:DNA-binding transcriptional MerR regulator/methylmalonyl-CoA mutase cobalamin-binding subunit